MTTFDGGVNYHGLSLEGEYYVRWLNNFHGPGTQVIPRLFDHGIQAQISAMILPKLLQLYSGGSTIAGKYKQPWDFRLGMNLYPLKNRMLPWNRISYLHKSPAAGPIGPRRNTYSLSSTRNR